MIKRITKIAVLFTALGVAVFPGRVAAQDSQLQQLLGQGQGDRSSPLRQLSQGERQNGTSQRTSSSESDQAADTPSGVPLSQEELLKRGDKIQNQLLKNPSDQEGLNKLIDSYVKKNYSSVFYTKTSSKGEMKVLLKNTKLYRGNTLTFAVVQQHVNQALDFSNATYTWTATRGDRVLSQQSGAEQTSFRFTPEQTGPVMVRVRADFPNGTSKTGRLSFDVYERTNIDYRPLNPGKGDSITMKATRRLSGENVTWKLDGEVMAQGTYEPSFKEYKGYGSEYNAEVIVKNPDTDQTEYYGETVIHVEEPTVGVQAYNPQTERTASVGKTLTVGNPQTLTFKAVPRSFSDGQPLKYIFRVNGDIRQEGEKSEFDMELDSQSTQTVTVAVQNVKSGQVAEKEVDINPALDKNALSASVNQQADNWPTVHYKGILVLGSVVMLGMVLSRIQ